jgi:hypothetical protein
MYEMHGIDEQFRGQCAHETTTKREEAGDRSRVCSVDLTDRSNPATVFEAHSRAYDGDYKWRRGADYRLDAVCRAEGRVISL